MKNNSLPIIIEYAGLTGCGKSTQCSLLINELYSKNIKVWRYNQVNKIVARSGIRFVYKLFVYLNPKRWKYMVSLRRFIRDYNNVSIQAIYCLISMYDISKWIFFWNKSSIVVFDEGFVQTLTSIPHINEIFNIKPIEQITKIITESFDVIVINCEAELKTTIARLRKRGNSDRFNSITNDIELEKALKIKKNNINKVANCFEKKISVNMNCEIDTIYYQYRNTIISSITKLMEKQ